MLNAPHNTTWSEAAVLLAGLILGGFLVSWVITDLLHWRRRTYIAMLGAVTAAGTVVVGAVTGASLGDLVVRRWPVGLLAALVTGAVTGMGLRRMERGTAHLSASELAAAAPWEGLLYGLAEGILLSVLPLFVVWQAAADAGWSDVPSGLVAWFASAAMIAIHHFGYWDYRGRSVGLVLVGCGILSLGYLLTGSLLAPAIGHVLMHLIGISGGVQLPPHVRPLGGQRFPLAASPSRPAPA